MFGKILLATAALLVVSTATASADNVNHRERRQAHRIFKGVQNGSLTFHEFKQLARGQAKVHRMERRARSDGFVDPWERARIQNELDRQSHRIYNKKH